jgi:hypothetical protein
LGHFSWERVIHAESLLATVFFSSGGWSEEKKSDCWLLARKESCGVWNMNFSYLEISVR